MFTRIPRGPSSRLATFERPRSPHLLVGVGRAEVRRQPGDRADVDDRAARGHQGRDGLDPEERAGEVDREHAIPVAERDLLEPGAERDAGVVDETVDTAVLCCEPRAERRPVVRARDVERAGTRSCPPHPRRRRSSSWRSVATTVAPSRASSLASAAPCPLAAPVTTTILPSTRPISLPSGSGRVPSQPSVAS